MCDLEPARCDCTDAGTGSDGVLLAITTNKPALFPYPVHITFLRRQTESKNLNHSLPRRAVPSFGRKVTRAPSDGWFLSSRMVCAGASLGNVASKAAITRPDLVNKSQVVFLLAEDASADTPWVQSVAD